MWKKWISAVRKWVSLYNISFVAVFLTVVIAGLIVHIFRGDVFGMIVSGALMVLVVLVLAILIYEKRRGKEGIIQVKW